MKTIKTFKAFNESEKSNQIDSFVNDIFEIWDELLDNDRKGIEVTSKGDKRTFLFDTTELNKTAFGKFHKEVIERLRMNQIKFEDHEEKLEIFFPK